MKEQDDFLTFDEVEQLCSLYLECGLSRLEEAELKYLLLHVPYHSSVIDAVREDILIESSVCHDVTVLKKTGIRRWWKAAGVAASVALLAGCSLMYLNSYSSARSDTDTIVAYESGRRLSDEEAGIAVRQSIDKAEALMAKAEAVERQYNDKQIQIINLK